MILARIAVAIPILCSVLFLSGEYRKKRSIESFNKWTQDQTEIKTEAKRRNSVKEKTETGNIVGARASEPPVDHRNSTTAHTPETLSMEKRDRVEVVSEGPFKGMTVEDAKADARQHLADEKAAATKRHKWELRRKELSQRRSKNIEQTVALAKAGSKAADDELQTMLSVFKLMPEEQLEQMRQQLLQTEPADEVNAFFDDLANHSSTKTPEQIALDAEKILKSREVNRAARRELQVQWEQIMLEERELERTKPY